MLLQVHPEEPALPQATELTTDMNAHPHVENHLADGDLPAVPSHAGTTSAPAKELHPKETVNVPEVCIPVPCLHT